jgi:hypothetical protein
MKSDRMKAGRFKTGGVLFIASGMVCFLAAVINKQPIYAGIGAPYISIGMCFIARSKKSGTS